MLNHFSAHLTEKCITLVAYNNMEHDNSMGVYPLVALPVNTFLQLVIEVFTISIHSYIEYS